MGSIKGFIDWVKGEDVEDEYEEEMPSARLSSIWSRPTRM